MRRSTPLDPLGSPDVPDVPVQLGAPKRDAIEEDCENVQPDPVSRLDVCGLQNMEVRFVCRGRGPAPPRGSSKRLRRRWRERLHRNASEHREITSRIPEVRHRTASFQR